MKTDWMDADKPGAHAAGPKLDETERALMAGAIAAGFAPWMTPRTDSGAVISTSSSANPADSRLRSC